MAAGLRTTLLALLLTAVVAAPAAADGASAGGGDSATNVPPLRPRVANRWPLCTSAVSAWRSVEREIPSWRHSSRSAGSRAPGASRPSLIAVPSRSSVSSNAVCDCTGAKIVCADAPGSETRTATPASCKPARCRRRP